MIEIEVGDTIVEFPDGTPQDVMQAALAKRFPAPSQAEPAPQFDKLPATPAEGFARPFQSYWPTQGKMAQEGLDTASRGIDDMMSARYKYEVLMGAGKTALGGLQYTASPLLALGRTFLGQPVEDLTGVPKEQTEFLAQSLVPGMGFIKAGSRAPVPRPVTPRDRLLDAAKRIDVDVPRAVASDNMVVQQTAAGLRNIPITGSPLISSAEKTVAQLGDKAAEVADSFGGGTVFGGGDAAKTGIINYITGKTKDALEKAYKIVDSLVDSSVTTPLEKTKSAVDEISRRREQAALTGESLASNLVSKAIEKPEGLNYAGLKDLRTSVGKLLKGGILPDGMDGGELKQIYEALKKDLVTAAYAAGGPRASAAFDRANTYAKLVAARREALAKIVGEKGEAPAELVFDRLAAMASSKSRADIVKLAQARKAIGADDWNEFASGVVSRMGRDPASSAGPETLNAAGFSPSKFMTSYGQLSQEGKNILFRSTGNSALANALDDIYTVSTRFKELQRLGNPSGTARAGSFTAVALSAYAEPLSAIVGVVGSAAASKILSNPASASSAARWARDYQGFAMNPSPRKFSALNLASTNLANNLKDLGVNVSPSEFMNSIRGSMRSPGQGPVYAPAGEEQQ